MAKYPGLYQLLNVEKDEQSQVSFLLFQSLFLGFFYGTLDIGAHALFLSEYTEEMLPMAFLISGFVGIILTTLYSRFQSIFKFSGFSSGNLFIIAVFMFLLWIGFRYFTTEIWVFVVFVMMGPLNIIAMIGFGGTTSRLFTLRQGKRLFGLVDAGQILGIIISSYAVPIILSMNVSTANLLLISAISISVAFVIQIFMVNKFRLNKELVEDKGEKGSRSRFTDIFKQPYTRVMAGFVALSVVVAFLVHYSFIAVTNIQYPENTELAKFLGYFIGTMAVFTLLVKTFVYSRLMKMYGLKLSLIISPLLIGLFALTSAVIGSLLGYTAVSASFAFFFLLISLTKLFSKALKDSVEAPSFKILYLSLDEKIRFDMQARIDGTINEISAVLSGAIMVGLTALSFIKLIHFNYVLVFFIGVWIFFAFRLYKYYQESLNSSLAGIKKSGEVQASEYPTIDKAVKLVFDSGNKQTYLSLVKIFSLWSITNNDKAIAKVLSINDKHIQLGQLHDLAYNLEISSLETIKNWLNKGVEDSRLADYGNKLIAGWEELQAEPGKQAFEDILKATNKERKIVGARLINADEKRIIDQNQLNTMLRDSSPEVRIEGIKMAGKTMNPEFTQVLVDLLGSSIYYSYAFNAIIEIGEACLPMLEQAFYKTGLSIKTLRRIIRLMGIIGGEQAIQFLLPKIFQTERIVVLEVVHALISCDYKADENERSQFFSLIEQSVKQVAWNLSANLSARQIKHAQDFKDMLETELQDSYTLLYELLSIAYNPQTIKHISESLKTGSSESVSFALELLDLVIDEEIKPVVLPAMNDISHEDKVKELQNFFPIEKMTPDELLLAVINRDYNYAGLLSKAYAVDAFVGLGQAEVPEDLLALMFHPDTMMSEISAGFIRELDIDKYNNCLERLPAMQRKKILDAINNTSESSWYLAMEKIRYLKGNKLFHKTPAYILYELAKEMKTHCIEHGKSFSFNVRDDFTDIFLILTGSVKLMIADLELDTFNEGEFIYTGSYLMDENEILTIVSDSRSYVYHIPGLGMLEGFFDEPKHFIDFFEVLNSGKTN